MMIMNATIYMAGLSRTIKVGLFDKDIKKEIFNRYKIKLVGGVEGAILNRLIKAVRDECVEGGVKVSVSIEPYGMDSIVHEYCEVDDVVSLCKKLTEMTTLILNGRRRDEAYHGK